MISRPILPAMLLLISSWMGAHASPAIMTDLKMTYSAEGGVVVGRNVDRCHNRPLYGPNIPSIVLAGDRPNVLYLHEPLVSGTFMAALARNGEAKWLDDFSSILTTFRPNHVSWALSDKDFPGVSIVMDVAPQADRPGFAVRLVASGVAAGERLIWAFGGVAKPKTLYGSAIWDFDPASGAGLGKSRFTLDYCEGNVVELDAGGFSVKPSAANPDAPKRVMIGRCSSSSLLVAADAQAWRDPLKLAASSGSRMPIVCGTTALLGGRNEVYWAVESVSDKALAASAQPKPAFEAGIKRAMSYLNAASVDTPDDFFNAAVSFLSAAMDGFYYPPVYVHGAMMWNTPFPGWRVTYGPIAFGCHEKVRAEGSYYIGFQEKGSEKQGNRPDPNLRLTLQAPDTRFYGRGWISRDQSFYNFQEEFFDQQIYEWRATADPELEKILRPALELHLERMRECFDPDDNGVYESYINTWATDSVWYSGAESASTTARAYNAHRAAAELARRAGDHAAAAVHRRRADKIRRAMTESLWMPEKGYLADSRETSGLHRLRDDTWLYNVSLPIDAEMMTQDEAAQMCYYTEWGLERVKSPGGGERCWLSNWAPYAWSIRELEPAENFHLALAYYRAGLGEDAWKLIKGSVYESAYNGSAPGAISSRHGADFADPTSMFARVVVEGLFGYRPDYPNGIVRLAPQFPAEWDHASITVPDFSLKFKRAANADSYEVSLNRPARMKITLPVSARKIVGVDINRKPAKWVCEAGFGHSVVALDLPRSKSAVIGINCRQPLPEHDSVQLNVVSGEQIELRGRDGAIVEFKDPQGALADPTLRDGALTATVTKNAGHHLVMALVGVGDLRRWQLFKLSVRDPEAEAREASRYVAAIPKDARWNCVDISKSLNGDVRTIYQQQYLTPRAKTCSVQLGIDGWSNWCFAAWQYKPPAIDLTGVAKLLDASGRLVTPRGVPFAWPGYDRNIAFTSRWDNWPRSVAVPIKAKGDAVWFLVAGSASHMQTMLAHGVLRLKYADGVEDSLELIHPRNYLTLENAYDHPRDQWPLPNPRPERVLLGRNCRAMLLNLRLRPGEELDSVTLETLSPEVVVGLMGVTVISNLKGPKNEWSTSAGLLPDR